MSIFDETIYLYVACAFYCISFVVTYLDRIHFQHQVVTLSSLGGLLNHSFSLAIRWDRIGHSLLIVVNCYYSFRLDVEYLDDETG